MVKLFWKTRSFYTEWKKGKKEIPVYSSDQGFVSEYGIKENKFSLVNQNVKLVKPLRKNWEKIQEKLKACPEFRPLFLTFNLKNYTKMLNYIFLIVMAIQMGLFIFWLLSEKHQKGMTKKELVTAYWRQLFISACVFRAFYIFLDYLVQYYYRKRECSFRNIISEVCKEYKGPRVTYKVGKGGIWIACRFMDSMGTIKDLPEGQMIEEDEEEKCKQIKDIEDNEDFDSEYRSIKDY